MQILELAIRNFGIHSNSALVFKPTTILMGRNGGGKSAIIESLLALSRLARQPASSIFQDSGPYSFDARHSFGTSLSEPIEFEIRFTPPDYAGERFREVTYRIAVARGAEGVEISEETLRDAAGDTLFLRRGDRVLEGLDWSSNLEVGTSVMALSRGLDTRTEESRGIRAAAASLRRILRFRFNPFSVSQEGDLYSEDEDEYGNEGSRRGRTSPEEPRLGFYGENVAGFLYWLRDFAGPDFRQIQEKMAELVPGFSGIEFSTAGPDPNKVGWEARYSDHRGVVPSRNLSSGTLSLLALLCVTQIQGGSKQPKVFCIEEPELGLTPQVTTAMFEYLANNLQSGSQLIVTTHSPHLWHPRIRERDSSAVLRLLPEEDGVAIESAEDALVREQGNPELARLRDPSGLGVAAALKLMEGVN